MNALRRLRAKLAGRPHCPECGGTKSHAVSDLPPEFVVCPTPGCCEILDAAS